MSSKNLILGMIKGYDYKTIEPFIVSLRNTSCRDDIVLFYTGIDNRTLRLLNKFNIQLIEFKEVFPYISVKPGIVETFLQMCAFTYPENIPVNTYRFIIWYLFLLQNKVVYENVLLTDVRDVAFQKNPFDFNIGGSLCCFVEDKNNIIRNDSFNSVWMLNAFGKDILKKIGDYNPSCCGVTIGNLDNIIDYLEKMNKMLNNLKHYVYGDDTAVHNYLIYMNKLNNLKLYENEYGPVLTLVLKRRETIRFNKEGRIINSNGDIVNILHQYDRHPEIREAVYRNNKLKFAHIRKLMAWEYFWKIGYHEYFTEKNFKKAKEYFLKGLKITPFDRDMLKMYIRDVLFRII